MFYPFNYAMTRNVRTIDNFGIPVLKTTYVTTDTATSTVTYGICPRAWRLLPCEGLFLLNVTTTPPTGTSDTALVFLDTCRFVNNTNTNTTFSNAKALLNGSGTQMPNNEITTGNRYLIYYNKACSIFQVVNHIVVPTAAA